MRTSIDLVDTLTLYTTGISGPDIVQVGADPVWEDGSDATYVDVVGKFSGDSQPALFSRAVANIAAQSFAAGAITGSESGLRFRIDIRLRGVQAGLPFPRVQLIKAGGGEIYSPTNAPTLTPSGIETVALEMSGFGGAWTAPNTYQIEVGPSDITPRPGTYPSDIQTRNWYIYEVRPHWYVPMLVAPPCRIFPRSDGLGVGAGRNYPPAKSQQRSSRGVGYY